MPATLQNTQVHPPVPNEWFEKYALPIEDADALDQDPDKDGFTNLDEWQGDTDPTNAESHPDYTTKLHLVSATEEPFPYIFASRTQDKFGINSIDQSEPTQFLKVGDIIRGTDFKIIKFTEKKESNGIKADVSELLLEHQQSHAQVTLVKGKVATSPQSVATFVYTWGGRREFEVRKDQEFSLEAAEGNQIQARRGAAGQGRHREYPKPGCADRDRLRESVIHRRGRGGHEAGYHGLKSLDSSSLSRLLALYVVYVADPFSSIRIPIREDLMRLSPLLESAASAFLTV